MTRTLPVWSGGDGPRVVIENHDPDAAQAVARLLRHEGFDVAICGGPVRDGVSECPLLEAGTCAVVEEADVVVYDLDPDRARDRTLLALMQRWYPGKTVVTELSHAKVRRYEDLLAGVHVVAPYSPEHLRDAVVDAAGGSSS
ncbi:MAG: hypothetical protein R3320_12880 [Nitriliruptorales bacterium]|nr:hypothetical protein [Nitriliruptorales bacterium]